MDAHLDYLRESVARNEFLDLTLAKRLASECHRLLEAVSSDGTEEPERRLARAAVRYFIQDEDGDSDADSILGLDDDALVLDAVIRELGLDHLLDPTEQH